MFVKKLSSSAPNDSRLQYPLNSSPVTISPQKKLPMPVSSSARISCAVSTLTSRHNRLRAAPPRHVRVLSGHDGAHQLRPRHALGLAHAAERAVSALRATLTQAALKS